MIALLDPGWIQGGFSILVGLFNGVVLKANVKNRVQMFFRLCQAAVTWSEAA